MLGIVLKWACSSYWCHDDEVKPHREYMAGVRMKEEAETELSPLMTAVRYSSQVDLIQ